MVYCPTQTLDGACWTLTPLGVSCAQQCGGAGLVDVDGLFGLSSTSAVASHLEQLYGIHSSSQDQIDQPCGVDAVQSLYVFVPQGFTNYGGEGRWHCLYGESYLHITPAVRSPCICAGGGAAPAEAEHHWYHRLFTSSPPPPPSLKLPSI